MDDVKNSRKATLNTAALVDLKAELIRKQDILKKQSLQRDGYDIETKSLKLKNDTSKLKVPLRGSSKKVLENEKLLELQEEEEKQLKRSREMLEQKAKLYEQMSTGETQLNEEESELYMVDFSKKTVFDGLIHQKIGSTDKEVEKNEDYDNDKSPIPNADWVDFIDKYGKKRTCLREDLPYYQDSNKIPAFKLANPSSSNTSNKQFDKNEDEDEEATKEPEQPVGPVHYQNVRNKEVRAHGVGYFAFSENEDERKKQMEMLKNMRQQTIKQRDLKEKAKQKRSALLKARLDKVRQRKNIEKPEEDGEDDDEMDSDNEQSLADIPLPDEMINKEEEIEPRPFHPRPWDKGKDFSQVKIPKIAPPKFKTASSQIYAERRREERLNEFAPPDIYSKRNKQNYGNFKSSGQWLPNSSATSDFSDCDRNKQSNSEESASSSNLGEENSDNIEDMVAKQLRKIRESLFHE